MNSDVLVVDDSLTVRMNLTETLEDAGLHVHTCANIQEAKIALSGGRFALAILDVHLPDGDGIELLREIREEPQTSGMGIMLLSTESEVGDRVRGLRMGADEYIGKPYEATYLIARAWELLRERRRTLAPVEDKETILIIDDSLTFREELKHALDDKSYHVITAENGEAGLRIAADIRPTAIVVDGILPGISGSTVIRRIRLDAALRRIPCILLTASEGRGAEVEALEAGADAFVRKDESISVVLARLHAVLRTAATRTHGDATASLQGPKKVLAVDDSETYLQELTEELRGEGYEVIMARSGEEALDLLSVQSVDCILMDLLMPGIGGEEACRRVKSTPGLRATPVLILTAREDQDAIIEGLGAGADDYIAKSSDFQVLRARVLAQIRRKQFEDENRLIREQMLRRELEASEARAARELAETRAALVEELERKNVELAAAIQAKDKFLATMSHELRTPLNAIIGFTGALQMKLKGQLPPQQEKHLVTVRQSAEHLLALINDLLDLAKIGAGKIELTLTPIVAQDILREIDGTLQWAATSKNIELCLDLPDENISILSDKRALSQIVLNLVNNAIKFTQSGSVRVVLRRSNGQSDPGIEISVIDTGIGIAPEDQARLFQPFSRIENSQAAAVEGTGLGLHLSQALAQLLGGRITCDSVHGKGSTFTLQLPSR